MAAAAIGSMRGSKLSSKEAALLAGELQKPSWESRNEGIHERVSFEDSIWGFDLAGGAYYKTPLRVTAVKRDSRADKAGIRPGDKLIRINDIDTSTLTIQEAHEIIIESGIHIRLAVSAPDDLEDSYHCYQDAVEEIAEMERQKKAEEEAERWRRIQSKFKQNDWSLQWPWVSKRRVIYKESNCYMVPSKYEDRHRESFRTFNPALQKEENIELFSRKTHTPTGEKKQPVFPKLGEIEEKTIKESSNNDIVSKKSITNDINGEKNLLEAQDTTTVDVQKSTCVPAANTRIEENETLANELNKEVELEQPNDKHENDEVVENEEVGEEEEEDFDEWDPNENQYLNETDVEEIFTEEEDMNEEDQNKIIDSVLNNDINDTEWNTHDKEI